MKITLSEQENALEETVMEHLQRLMLRYNESQREKNSWSEMVFVSQLSVYTNGFDWFRVCSNNDEYSFSLISREGL